MKKLALCITALLSLSTLPAYADGMPDLPVDSRIRILTYDPHDVYTVPTKYGYQTSIVFSHNEQITTVSVGDRSMWQIVPSGNRIFIRPMDENLATNMTVITNIREYNFDIKSVTGGQTSNLYVVQFRYPNESTASDTTSPAAVASAPSTPVTIPPLDTQRSQNINEAYSYTGPDELAPSQVYDDGKTTYVLYEIMPSPAPRPIVTGPSGKTATAKHEIKGNKMTIHTVMSNFILRNAKGQIAVYNELYKP